MRATGPIPATIGRFIDPGEIGDAIIDGSDVEIPVVNTLSVVVGPGSRMFVEFVPPSAAHIVGTINNTWVDAQYRPYTDPTWTNFTDTDATIALRYRRNGYDVHYVGSVTLGAGSALGGATLQVSLPVDPAPVRMVGSAFLNDATTRLWTGLVTTIGGVADLSFYHNFGTALTNGAVTSSQPFTWVPGDTFGWDVTYEAAVN